MDLLDGENFGHRFGLLQFHAVKGFSGSFAGLRVEELDAGEGDSEPAAGELFLVFKIQEGTPQLGFGDLVRASLAIIRQLPNSPEIAMHSSLAHAGQFEIVLHSLVEFSVEVLGVGGAFVVINLGFFSLLNEVDFNKGKMPAPCQL